MCRSECYGYGVTLCMLSVAEQHRPELSRHAQASAPGKWNQRRPTADKVTCHVFLPSPRLTDEARNWEQRAEGSVRREYREACEGNTGKRSWCSAELPVPGCRGWWRGRGVSSRKTRDVRSDELVTLLGDNQVLTLARRNGLRYPPGFRLQASASE